MICTISELLKLELVRALRAGEDMKVGPDLPIDLFP
jgi:hypothetical protein